MSTQHGSRTCRTESRIGGYHTLFGELNINPITASTDFLKEIQ